MLEILQLLLRAASSFFRSRRDLAIENLALRHQLAVLGRAAKKPRLENRDRLLWIVLARWWRGWRSAVCLVKPETVIGWHRRGFAFYWRRKCSRRTGRPRIATKLRVLIRLMARENPLWGAPRIHGELVKLGIEVSEATVSRYMEQPPRAAPSQTWKTFLDNHLRETVAVDSLSVPTATFRVLFVFVVLSHDRRRILHIAATFKPTAEWTGRQIRLALQKLPRPRFVLRDGARDFGLRYQQAIDSLGIDDLVTSPASPWQNGYVERVIGTIRRECLDHVIVFNDRHLLRILGRCVEYCGRTRTHLGLEKDAPISRPIDGGAGEIRSVPEAGGLHHRYTRMAG